MNIELLATMLSYLAGCVLGCVIVIAFLITRIVRLEADVRTLKPKDRSKECDYSLRHPDGTIEFDELDK